VNVRRFFRTELWMLELPAGHHRAPVGTRRARTRQRAGISVFLGCVLLSVGSVSAEELKAYCEWKPHNTAVQDFCPEFHWQVEEQTHCRVLVASSLAQLARNHGSLWDSGKVETVVPVLEYAGEPLNDGRAYCWKAQVWTKKHRNGSWTKPQAFRLRVRPPLPARWGHVRLFHQFGSDGPWMQAHSDTQWGGKSTHQDHRRWKRFIMHSGLFATMVIPSGKAAALEDFCLKQGLTNGGIAEEMFLHLASDAIVRLQKANMNLEREARVIPGWDSRNDRNADGRVDDEELATLVNPAATARTMEESRLRIYYWTSNGKPDGPRDYIMNVGDPNYRRFIATVYVRERLQGADGFWSDTCGLRGIPHMFAYESRAKGSPCGIIEYPAGTRTNYNTDLLGMVAQIKLNSPDKVVTGNGWYSTPCIMDGCYFEHLYHVGMGLEELEPIIERAEEIERRGKLQWLMFTPSLNLATPDWKRNGKKPQSDISPQREQMFALAVYCLVHGRYSYWTLGRHGLYGPSGAKKLWFDGIGADIRKPLGPRFVFKEQAPAPAKQKANVVPLVNGDFEGGHDMPGWQKAGPVRIVEELPQGRRFCALVESTDPTGNFINKQYVNLKPHTGYKLTFRMKTKDLAGTAHVYPYEFDGADYGGTPSRCSAQGTTPWTNYAMTFTTGDDGRGRVSFRISKGQGKAWFDDIALSEGGGERWKVMARRFSKGLVLVRLGGAGCDRSDRSAITFKLDKPYHRVAEEGKIGEEKEEGERRKKEGERRS